MAAIPEDHQWFQTIDDLLTFIDETSPITPPDYTVSCLNPGRMFGITFSVLSKYHQFDALINKSNSTMPEFMRHEIVKVIAAFAKKVQQRM